MVLTQVPKQAATNGCVEKPGTVLLLTVFPTQVGELEPERLGRAYVFLNKVRFLSNLLLYRIPTNHFAPQSHKAMPYINRPYRNRPALLDHLSRYIDPPEDSPPQTNFVVDLAPFPSHFLPNGRAVFPASKRKDYERMKDRDVRPEVLIYATGYRQDFSFLAKDYPTADQANIRNVVREGDESVAFIGFVRPGVGMFNIFRSSSNR
ncbi:hypothetical protein AAF712_002449 [Marasmius tenuissimus]|uniref:Uncharacterized protein n=1 Tax=Marasmius tenuissimus TaxID=585030 RepID=A0ABR3AC84_9AGAR